MDPKEMLEHEAWFSPDGDAASIPGFLSPSSADALSFLLTAQLQHNIVGSLAEIGTYMGKTFIGLVKATREGEVVVGYDLFPETVEQGFKRSLGALTPEQVRRVLAVRRDSMQLDTAEWIKSLRQPARFVHVDGGHNRRAIISDLQLVSSSLSSKALVVIDDFLHDWYPDLTEGIVDGLRASRNIVPFAVIPRLGPVRDGGTKLICSVPDGVEFYRGLLADRYKSKGAQMRKFIGHDVLTFQAFQ